MYAAVWTPLVYAVTTAAAGMRILSAYGHCVDGCFDAVLRPRSLAPTMRRTCLGGMEFQCTQTDNRL